jgi:hypothetical protein
MDSIGHLGPYTHLQHLPANLRTKKYVHPLEKPTGLLGNATLLHPDDHVANFVAEFRRVPPRPPRGTQTSRLRERELYGEDSHLLHGKSKQKNTNRKFGYVGVEAENLHCAIEGALEGI